MGKNPRKDKEKNEGGLLSETNLPWPIIRTRVAGRSHSRAI